MSEPVNSQWTNAAPGEDIGLWVPVAQDPHKFAAKLRALGKKVDPVWGVNEAGERKVVAWKELAQ